MPKPLRTDSGGAPIKPRRSTLSALTTLLTAAWLISCGAKETPPATSVPAIPDDTSAAPDEPRERTPDLAEPGGDLTRCPEVTLPPDQVMCAAIYRPVCATVSTGVTCVTAPCPEAISLVTFSNACEACRLDNVLGHREGACEPESFEE